MRILLINVLCGKGSTGKIVYALYCEYRNIGHEVSICHGRGPTVDEPGIFKFNQDWRFYRHALKTGLTGYVGYGNRAATRRLIRHIEEYKPDVVHLHNIHGYYVDAYMLLNFLKNSGIPTVYTMHDKWVFTGKCGHSYECERWREKCGNCPLLREYPISFFFDKTAKEHSVKREIFRDYENITFTPVSAWLAKKAMQSPILSDKRFVVVHNGIDLDIFHPTETKSLRSKLGLEYDKVLLHVTPNFNDSCKGGKYVLDLARKLEGESVKIIVIGANKLVKNSPSNVLWIPRTENQRELAAYYTLADAALITSKKETFSLFCAESVCCGTPIVGFECGAPSEMFPSPYSFFVEYGDMGVLEKVTRSLITGDIELASADMCAEYGRKHYAKQTMCDAYLRVYEDMLSGSSK